LPPGDETDAREQDRAHGGFRSARLSAADAHLGVVLQANFAHGKESAITEAATVYPGDELSTDLGGSLDLRIVNSRFGLSHVHKACAQDDEPSKTDRFRKVALTAGGGGPAGLVASKFLTSRRPTAESPDKP
jgi:hypothetical protein